jgi:hypothetical protein
MKQIQSTIIVRRCNDCPFVIHAEMSETQCSQQEDKMWGGHRTVHSESIDETCPLPDAKEMG